MKCFRVDDECCSCLGVSSCMCVCLCLLHTHTHTPFFSLNVQRSGLALIFGSELVYCGPVNDTHLHIKHSLLSTARHIHVRCIYIVSVPQMQSSETVCKGVNQMVHTFRITKEQHSSGTSCRITLFLYIYGRCLFPVYCWHCLLAGKSQSVQ